MIAPSTEDVHVWKFELDCDPFALVRSWELLSRMEQQRKESPETLQFEYGPQEKPTLASGHSASLRFTFPFPQFSLVGV